MSGHSRVYIVTGSYDGIVGVYEHLADAFLEAFAYHEGPYVERKILVIVDGAIAHLPAAIKIVRDRMSAGLSSTIVSKDFESTITRWEIQ